MWIKCNCLAIALHQLEVMVQANQSNAADGWEPLVLSPKLSAAVVFCR
ncbi:hypothetical protein [Gloeocapsopsis dulcis]|nr:hypothetical protein [Gloeocapsopsis dulcis]WNN89686.1 hypothetical protein P0S91_00885 [Gloeocapsopsis dulcis]